MERAERRCECSGKNCRHHLSCGRCKRGLRGDEWKVFWRTESGGTARDNIEAWCPECFANNFEVPREMVALLAIDISGYARLLEEDRRSATTLRSILRDAAKRAADECRGRLVLVRVDDDILVECPTSQDGVKAARRLCFHFQDFVRRLDVATPDLCAALHCGEVTRWRNGFLAGDAIDVATSIRKIAEAGQILLTEPAAAPVRGSVELEPTRDGGALELPSVGDIWAMRL